VITVVPVRGLPEVRPGDDLAALIAEVADLADGDVLVVAQKVVSKAEGCLLPVPADADPLAARREIARAGARRVVADAPWALIVETRHGFVCANGGLDTSNVPDGFVLDLPEDPDASARLLRDRLRALTGRTVAVIVSDTFGRPWRTGQTDVAIGVAGIGPLRDERGTSDRGGRALAVTEAAIADELAGAADLVRTKADGAAAVVVRGLRFDVDERASAAALVRPAEHDLFRRGAGMLADALAGPLDAPLGAPAPHLLERALDAGRAVAGPHVGMEVEGAAEGAAAVVRLTATSEAGLVEAGMGAGVLVAAALDLGLAARWLPRESGASGAAGLVVRVEVGGPDPGGPRRR
jgi:coenzyme F420-0:L-glutamate ligase / coenzyme F420-1:gamma-L-glutamate ligase